MKCILFYSPRAISNILCVVYIPPSTVPASAAQQLADHVHTVENSNHDSTALVLGDFNHVSMQKTLRRYKPQIQGPTRLDIRPVLLLYTGGVSGSSQSPFR